MRGNKWYENKKCTFCAPEIPGLGSHVSEKGVCADPEKVSSICAWPVPNDQKQPRQWLGLANYLHHYAKDFVAAIHPLSQLLKKNATWSWHWKLQKAFDEGKRRLSTSPVLPLSNHYMSFYVVCDASDLRFYAR